MASQSLVSTAYTILKERIIEGRLLPGTLISENEIADELKMSRTPVRNAITHLESEGLVVSLKNRGVLVKEILGKEFLDMYEATMAMLVYTLDVIRERGIQLNLARLEDILDKQLQAEQADDYLSYIKHSMLFIKAVVSSIQNQAMLAVMEGYVDKISMAAYLNYMNTPYVKHYSANELNRSIFRALSEGKEDEAKRIVKDALATARDRMLANGQF
ncbi:GntR family transcriptional regulator [Paenibacillus soyae]|uniref:GntR family transcriptional regulator n=1 Tax=Paenibacillus soyae TaxID=2969249 RepID=A0A9X2MXK7_9BACL|nr:GntR family transcriptional regulator [Paenibacillus soyae]MCR2807768.1 GntR family transcriptional regulator [Paenibacillus soyae]